MGPGRHWSKRAALRKWHARSWELHHFRPMRAVRDPRAFHQGRQGLPVQGGLQSLSILNWQLPRGHNPSREDVWQGAAINATGWVMGSLGVDTVCPIEGL
eukprot:6484325-Amphidinium_carterae.1